MAAVYGGVDERSGFLPILARDAYVVGKDVTESILHAVNNGLFPAAINHTYVTLIPKRKNPELVSDYRPISLYNMINKLISKILANRLKLCLPAIISPSQIAFVPGRLITNNVLVAYEMIHFLRRKRKGKDGFMSLKLEMSKAYDRVEWSFLQKVMEQMGFSEKWVKLIMFCVQTISFSILVNGEPKRPIFPTRGLRQGNPISPYLFLLCTEGLILLLNRANSHNQVEGIRVCRWAPKLNHLLFADDVVLFCRVNMQTCLTLQHKLDIYEKASGQKINREKTSMVFSQNVNQSQQDEIMQFWGVHQFQQYDKYLGLPPMVGRGKYQAFSSLNHRVWAKMHGWKEKLLSQGGKEILLKAMSLSIPTYTMSCFKLPRSLCSELEGMMARFWVGQKSNERKICWINWKKMCESKLSGGLGFKNLQMFNMALLAKQGWRIMTQESSLLHRIFKARYFATSSFKDSKLGGAPSFVWRGIWEAKTNLLKGCRWRVGNGLSINIWTDYWLPNHKLVPITTTTTTSSVSEMDNSVASLMMQNPRRWDMEKVRSLILAREANEVLCIRLPSENVPDTLVWEHEKSGMYSVKSAYQFFLFMETDRQRAECSSAADQNLLWKKLWKLNISHRIRVFAWRTCKNILPTLQNLKPRKVIDNANCQCDQCRSGIGVVLRDDKGQVTFATSKPENALTDPMEIELTAILRGIQLCIPLGIVELQIEIDALVVIEELKKEGRSSTLWSTLIQEIKALLSTLPNWSIQYRGRESNGVAHALAKFAWHLDDIALWQADKKGKPSRQERAREGRLDHNLRLVHNNLSLREEEKEKESLRLIKPGCWYCKYHQTSLHWTEDCMTMRKRVVELAGTGELEGMVAERSKPRRRQETRTRRDLVTPPPVAVTYERDIEVRDDRVQQHAEVNEPLELVTLYTDCPGTTTRIGTQVPLADREALIQLLIEHRDILAWSHEEMPGIENKVIEHCLGVDPTHKAMRQKRRSFSMEK
ncbi:uncharacterized protein LOC122289223 [Carya illinoinensis]|uniref:uncharacterized protein LOC122289223 n=1 Tax=Carya illinoinensis TaxID=32201 RepID=UPI001C722499|nr:uncharacterized protein LOC122289223 [Carya illinoinensis]